jgi:cytochrome c-type biogenesis protein CcmE
MLLGFFVILFFILCLISTLIMFAFKNHIAYFYGLYIFVSIIVLCMSWQSESPGILSGINTIVIGVIIFLSLFFSSLIYFVLEANYYSEKCESIEDTSIDNHNVSEIRFNCCNQTWDNTYKFCPKCGKKLE